MTRSDELRKMVAEATPGPWVADGEPWNRIIWSDAENRVCFMAHSGGLNDDRDIATSELAAQAPTLATDLAAALDEVEALRAEAVRLRKGLTVAAMDVLLERLRQITVEGWTPEHDDLHCNGEMAQAAACYADPAPKMWADTRITTPVRWPQEWASWWKPTSRRQNLVKAGALILAEIERLDRAALTGGQA